MCKEGQNRRSSGHQESISVISGPIEGTLSEGSTSATRLSQACTTTTTQMNNILSLTELALVTHWIRFTKPSSLFYSLPLLSLSFRKSIRCTLQPPGVPDPTFKLTRHTQRYSLIFAPSLKHALMIFSATFLNSGNGESLQMAPNEAGGKARCRR